MLRPESIINRVLAPFVCLWIAGGGFMAAAKPTADPARPVPSGDRIYRQSCAACHGENLEAPEGVADLRRIEDDYAVFVRVVNQGGDIMPSFEGVFSKAEMKALYDYVMKNSNK